MKKQFLRTLLAAVLLTVVGASATWAQTTTLLEYGTTDAPWTEASLTEWTAGGTPTITDGYVGISGGNGSYETSITTAPAANAIINVQAVWRGQSNTGRDFSKGNGSYFRFGNIIVVQNDQDKKHGYGFAGLGNIASVTTFSAGSYRVEIASCSWLLIDMEINTANNTVTSFTVKSEDGATTYASASGKVLTDADYTTVAFGYRKSGSVSTANAEQLKFVKVTQTIQAVETAEYTVKYVCNGEEVKEAEARTGVAGQNIALTDADLQNFYSADGTKKYIYVSNDSEGKTVSEGVVVTVTFREAEKYAWTAKSSVGTYTINGETFEGDKASVKYPLYVLVEGKLWTKDATDKVFAQNFDITENNQVVTLEYTETDIDKVAFLAEIEDIEGMGIVASGNAEARSSQRAAGYSASGNTLITTLSQGKYKLVAAFYSPTSAGGKYNFFTGTRNIWEVTTGNSNSTVNEQEIVLAKESNEILLGQTGATAAVDYIYIQQLEVTDAELAEATQADMAAALAEAKAKLLDAINLAKEIHVELNEAYFSFGLEIEQMQAIYDNPNASVDEVNNAVLALVAGVNATLCAAIENSINSLKALNASGLDNAINAAEAVKTNGDSTIPELREALATLIGTVKTYINGMLVDANAFFATFDDTAAIALAEDFEAAETSLNGTDIDAIVNAVKTLAEKAVPYAKTALEEKAIPYLKEINDETVNADIAAIQAAIQANNLTAMVAAAKKAQTDFIAAVPAYIVQVKAIDTEGKNGAEELAAAIAAAETAIAAEGATFTTIALAIRELVLAVKAFEEANKSVLMSEAIELAKDENAVAVGKLIAAIDEATQSGDESNLQTAIDQFKADNADQEKDETNKVDTNGWKKFDGSNAGICSTDYAPAITTYDGRTANLAESFEGNGNRTGTIIYQDITGLSNGQYKVGFYGNAFSTSLRDKFECTMEDGAEDVAYVFANNEKAYIAARIAISTTENNFRTFDVTVTDGTIKLGMGKDTEKSTNWHTMQIYQLTWFTTAKEVYAQDQDKLQALVAEATTLVADEYKTNGKDQLQEALSAAELAVNSNMYNITELEEIIDNLMGAIAAFKKANYYIDLAAGEYYIIDAGTGLMMAAGHNWGTRGIVNELGLDLILTPDEETRTVTIDSRVTNGGNDNYLGINLYMDQPVYGWALEYRDGSFYIKDPESGKYITIDNDNNLVLDDTPHDFNIVSKEDMMTQRLAEMANATAENPVDATFLITANNFNRNDKRNSAWTIRQGLTGEGHTTNISGGNNVNNCAEAYHTDFTVSQNLEGAPAGIYKMTAQGFYRQDDEVTEDTPFFYIGDASAGVPVLTTTEDNMSAASESFTNGLYTIEPIEFIYNGETEFQIGVATNGQHQWVIFDNFQLTYYGPLNEEPEVPGDLNNDEIVTTSDAVVAMDYVLRDEYFAAADIAEEFGVLDIADVTAIVDRALHWGEEEVEAAASARQADDDVNFLTLNGNEVSLTNSTTFIGFQMDVTLAEGATFNGAQLGARAAGLQVAYNRIGQNTWRVVAFSLQNTPIVDNDGALITLNITGMSNITISNARFSDNHFRGRVLTFGQTTGINTLGIDTANAEVYNAAGTRQNGMQKGMNIVRQADGQVRKVLVK